MMRELGNIAGDVNNRFPEAVKKWERFDHRALQSCDGIIAEAERGGLRQEAAPVRKLYQLVVNKKLEVEMQMADARARVRI